MELLSRKKNLVQKAVIDGSICYPQPAMARYCIATVRLCGRLMFGKNACRFQLAVMNRFFPSSMRYPEEIAEYYLRDMPRLRKETLYAVYRTCLLYTSRCV